MNKICLKCIMEQDDVGGDCKALKKHFRSDFYKKKCTAKKNTQTQYILIV